MSARCHEGLKVLIVGNVFGRDFGADFYMIMPKLLHGFIRLGCNVNVFNDREVARASTPILSTITGWAAANRKLIATCRNFRPDLLLLGHCELIQNETLAKIRNENPDLRIAYRNVDALTDATNRSRLARRADVADGIFVTTAAPIHGLLAEKAAKVHFIPNPVDPAIDTGRAFARSDQDYDVFFAAGVRDNRVDIVEQAVGRVPRLRADIRCNPGKPPVFGAEYLVALTNARMGISISRPDDVYLYASDRMSQLLGNGLLTFVSRTTGFQDLFGEEQVVFFSSIDEIVDKLRHFARNDDQRRAIAKAGWAAAHSMFASDLVAKYILERSFGEQPSETYHWQQEISTPVDSAQRPNESMVR